MPCDCNQRSVRERSRMCANIQLCPQAQSFFMSMAMLLPQVRQQVRELILFNGFSACAANAHLYRKRTDAGLGTSAAARAAPDCVQHTPCPKRNVSKCLNILYILT